MGGGGIGTQNISTHLLSKEEKPIQFIGSRSSKGNGSVILKKSNKLLKTTLKTFSKELKMMKTMGHSSSYLLSLPLKIILPCLKRSRNGNSRILFFSRS